MKKLSIILLSLLSALLLVFGFACSKNPSTNLPNDPQESTLHAKLVDFEDFSLEADYNEVFDFSQYLMVKDVDGNTYTATATVFDHSFKKIELTENSFKLQSLSYTVKLKVKLSEMVTAIRQIKISVIDYSDFVLEFSTLGLPTWGINNEFVLPKAVGTRQLSGETSEATIKVFLDDAVRTEQTVKDGKFTPKSVGKYIVEASVVDERNDDKTYTKQLTFNVLEEMPCYLEEFCAGAQNVKSAANFNLNNGQEGIYIESHTDMDGVTEFGIGKATMQHNGKTNGYMALRFNKTKDELKEIMGNIESMTFRLLVKDSDFIDGAAYPLKFFNIIDKVAYVNKWTDITLTKAELFNATLVACFGSNQALIEEEPYGFASGFACDGLGYLRKNNGTVYRLLHCDAYAGLPTEVYIDKISYTIPLLENFAVNADNVKSGASFANGGNSEWLTEYTDEIGVTEYGVGKAVIASNTSSIALRFNKTKDELKSIISSIDSISFRILVKDGDLQGEERVPLQFFGNSLRDTARNPIVNQWTTVSLTRTEILNEYLKAGFSSEAEAIEAFAAAYCLDGMGVTANGENNTSVLGYATGATPTEVYIDEVTYATKITLVNFEDVTIEANLNVPFSFDEYLIVKDYDEKSYQCTAQVFTADGNLVVTHGNRFTPCMKTAYRIVISVMLTDGRVESRTITVYADNNLATFATDAENIKSAPNFNANNGDLGVHLESYTDKDGVTEYGVGKATMQNNGGGTGYIALRFDRNKVELKEILNSMQSITFRILVVDGDFADGATYPLKFFDLIEKDAYVNKWTDITLTREEIFNATLVGYFGSEQEMIESEPYGFASGFACDGLGYLRKGSGSVYRMLFGNAFGGSHATDVYIGEIKFATENVLVNFSDVSVDADIGGEFSFEEFLSVRDAEGQAYETTVAVYDAKNQLISTIENKFTLVDSKYTIKISVTFGNVTKTRIITVNAGYYFDKFKEDAENIKSAPNFNENNGDLGVYWETYTDKNGVTEQGVGKATMQNNGGGTGYVALRFDKTVDELKGIMPNVETITFRILITDADFADGEVYNLKFFNLIDKQARVNEWMDITLTREEIFNATLLNEFGGEQAMIESEPYGFANGFACDGLGYLRKDSGAVYRMLFSNDFGGSFATDVYLDSVSYTLSSAS